MNNYPARQGLYDPQFEHDACGVAFVADMHGRQSRDIVEKGIQALVNLDHRGAAGAESNTGDGAGILIQVPDRFYREEMATQGVELPPAGQYATGIAFLPNSRMAALDAQRDIEKIIAEEGLTFLGWRTVDVDDSTLGAIARDAEPMFAQLFLSGQDQNGNALEGLELDRRAWFVRKRAERELGAKGPGVGVGADTVYFPSLSARTIVYKGMLTTPQLRDFYLDLQDERMESALAIVHSRFSTNTFPSWPLAHPYRMLAHNGEINTVRGNENWMRARESQIRSEILGDINRVLPICDPTGSDTGRFDEALELLHLGGRSLPHAVLMMVPQAWERAENLDPEVRAFYEYHSTFMEAWDGPAALAFTDGTVIGSVLDRNGLRPGRIWITKDGLVVMASEAGVLDIPEADVVERTRVEPGKMFLVDTARGCVVDDAEVKRELANQPYKQWVDTQLVRAADLPEAPVEQMNHERVVLRQRVFGYTEEDLELILRPMATTGAEGIGSMGTDTPIAALSNRSRLLYDFFAQRFAQVTNPPLDSIREKMVTSLYTHLGAQGDILNPVPEAAHRIHLDTPVLLNEQLAALRAASEKSSEFKSTTIRGLYPVAHGGAGMRQAIEHIRKAVSAAIADGVSLIILSDRESDERNAPIPSLLLTSAVHQHLVREKTRTQASLIIESGDCRETHHTAMLVTFGADAINPYMALETAKELSQQGRLAAPTGQAKDGAQLIDEATAQQNLVHALAYGLQKIMSKMGIATVASYRGAQLADITGLHQLLLDEYFTGGFSPISGMDLEAIAGDVAIRHREAFLPRPEEQAHRELEIGGEYKWRREGEYHLFNPETVFKLQHATRTGQYRIFKEYTEKVDNQSKRLATLRGLFEFSSDRPSIPVEEVEPVESIVQRFSTGAMSYGSISAEAHETLAIAMNRLKGKSNSGEGGEDPDRFTPDANGDWRRSAIKQVASGRFGVTSHYLNNCTDIQIKMAQGAKPGEGGQLPPNKVYPWIAEVRVTTPGVGLISPPPHHDIYSIEDLAQLIHDLKNANPDARIHVKLVSEQGVGTVAAGVSKAHADVVLISGHDGGTGASPLNSLKHAGGPWELGLAETQQTLLMNGLRDRIVVQCDGQLKTGRDVVVAALLGAEEFGFATAPLVVSGCIMMRVCHLDTCPVGVATQNPELRKRYTGQADHVVNFFTFIAEEVREYLAELGFRTLEEAVGHSECLTGGRMEVEHKNAGKLDLSPIFARPDSPFMHQDLHHTKAQNHNLEAALDNEIRAEVKETVERAARGENVSVTLEYPITNVNRSVGTMIGSMVSRIAGREGLPLDTLDLRFNGSAGNSFGAFTTHGMTLTLRGDANDYVGKGLSGGRIVIRPSADSGSVAPSNVIAGNVLGFGGVEGEMFICGTVGERFCVRNSGVTAVVEGIGNHGCEYMTGGRVIVLGSVGNNFAAGMSGGIAYLLDDGSDVASRVNPELVEIQEISDAEEISWLSETIDTHRRLTGSTVDVDPKKLIKVMPRDYDRVLRTIARAEAEGLDQESTAAAIMEEVK